jgi:hypothetical protein
MARSNKSVLFFLLWVLTNPVTVFFGKSWRCLIVANPVAVMDPMSGGPLAADRISPTTVIQVAGLVLQVNYPHELRYM